MTVNISKPAIVLREELAKIDSSRTVAEAALPKAGGTMTGVIAGFDSTGIADNATATKLTVADTGIDVTGTVTADGLVVDTTADNGAVITAYDNATTTYPLKVQNSAGTGRLEIGTYGINNNIDLKLQTQDKTRLEIDGSTGDISFMEDTGTTAKFFWDASAESLGIGTSSPSTKVHIVGSSSDTVSQATANLQIEGSGGNGVLIGTTSTGFDSYIQAGFMDNLGTATYDLLLNPEGGLVGIGTNSPSAALDVRKDGTSQQLQIWRSDLGVNDRDLNLTSPTSDSATEPFRFQTGNAIAFRVDATDALLIDSTGKVGIGATSIDANSNLQVQNDSGNSLLRMRAGASSLAGIDFGDSSDIDIGGLRYNNASNYMQLNVNAAERMRIDSSGGVLVGTDTSYNSNFRMSIACTSATGGVIIRNSPTQVSNFPVRFESSGGSTIGGINTDNTSTSYNTSSDYRLKTDVQPMTGATATFKQLKPVNFEWISSGERVDGFLAHELQEVIPAAATGTKDAMKDETYVITEATEATYDEEGTEVTAAVAEVTGIRSVPDMQGIDQSKVVPLLTATIQELIARIEALEAL